MAVVRTRKPVSFLDKKKNEKAIYLGSTFAWEFRKDWQPLVNAAKLFRAKFDSGCKQWALPNVKAAQLLAEYLIGTLNEADNLVFRDFETGQDIETDVFIKYGSIKEARKFIEIEAKQSAQLSLSVRGREIFVSNSVDKSGRPVQDHAQICGLAYIGGKGEWIVGEGYKISRDHNEVVDAILRMKKQGLSIPIRGVPNLMRTPFITEVWDDTIYKHQCIGVKFLYNRPDALLADDMGLGKTMQSILAAEQLKNDKKAERLVIVCPVSLMGNWENELKMWESTYEDIIIVAYSRFKKFEDQILDVHKKTVVIVDEAHYLKNPSSQRTKNFMGLFDEMKRRKSMTALWLLTGTPVTKDYSDIWSLSRMMKHPVHKMYIPSKLSEMGKDILGIDILRGALKTKVMIRKKTDTLDLPPKIKKVIDYETKQETLLNNSTLKILAYGATALAMDHLMRLKRLTAVAKIEGTLEHAHKILAEGRKVILFTDHTEVLNELESEFSKFGCVRICGKSKNRTEIVERFQKDDSIKVFIGNIKAAGVGITLTASSDVVFNDFTWLPSDMQQAEDRAHRIGINGTVNIYYIADQNMILDKILLRKLGERSAEIATFEGSKQSIMSEIREWASNQID